MAYDGQTIVDLDVTRPDGDAEPKSILDDVTKEIKRAFRQTTYCWTRLQNSTGSGITAGDVLAIAPNGLVVNDNANSFLKYVVATENIAIAAFGTVARDGGPVDARVAGAVVAYNYLRKSATTKALEDMNIPVVANVITPTGAVAIALASVPSAGLCSVILFANTVVAPTDIANSVVNMVNRTGVVVAPGAAVSPDPSNDTSVILNDVKGSLRPILVAYESITNNTMGKWIQNGVQTVQVPGPITRLHYLRKSATSMALESTGVSATAIAVRPPGTVGIAVSEYLGSGPGTCKALLFGATADVATMSLPKVTNLYGVGVNGFTRSYQGHRASLYNPIDGSTIVLPLSGTYTNNNNINGRGGRDQANTFNPNTYIYFYLTWDGATIATRSSVNAPNIGPNMSGGETHFAFLDVIRRESAGNLINITTRDDWSYYLDPQQVGLLSILDTASVTEFITSSFVPGLAPEFDVSCFGHAEVSPNHGGGYVDFELWIGGNTAFRHSRLGITGVSDANTKRDGLGLQGRIPNTGFFAGYWRTIQNTGSPFTVVAAVNVTGYKNPS